MSVYNNQHNTKSRSHNWVHFFHRLLVFCHLELKLCYLKNLNLFSITVKKLFERMVDDEFWIFLKAFSWETDINLSNARWFYSKKPRKIGKGNLHFTENWLSINEIWCAVYICNHMCHKCGKGVLVRTLIKQLLTKYHFFLTKWPQISHIHKRCNFLKVSLELFRQTASFLWIVCDLLPYLSFGYLRQNRSLTTAGGVLLLNSLMCYIHWTHKCVQNKVGSHFNAFLLDTWSKHVRKFNPRPPEVFFVTRPPREGLLQPPPWILRNVWYPYILLPMYRYGPLLSIDIKMSTIEIQMSLLWLHKVSAPSQIWMCWKYTLY